MASFKVYSLATTSWIEYLLKPATHIHSAADISSGILVDARIPSLNASKITTGVFGTDKIPSLDLDAKLFSPSYKIGGVPRVLKSLFDTTRPDRTAFLPADQIIIEKSIDAGTTWQDAGYTDSQKRQLFTGQRPTISLPLIGGIKHVNAMIRITITGMKYNQTGASGVETARYNYWNSTYVMSTERYCTLDEGWAWVSSNSDRLWFKVERATGAVPNTWANVREGFMSGWSGGNYFSLDSQVFGGGTTQTGNSWNWRITFRTCTSAQDFNQVGMATTYTTSAQAVHHIKLTGQNVWTAPNKLMYQDHLYGWDEYLNAEFPADVKANGTALVKTNDARMTDARTPTSHSHTKEEITNFPASMPASDVFPWAKAESKPAYGFSEIGNTPNTLGGYGITNAPTLTNTNQNLEFGGATQYFRLAFDVKTKAFIKHANGIEYEVYHSGIGDINVTNSIASPKIFTNQITSDGGFIAFTGLDYLNFNGALLKDIGEPSLAQDAATKNYVDIKRYDTIQTADTFKYLRAHTGGVEIQADGDDVLIYGSVLAFNDVEVSLVGHNHVTSPVQKTSSYTFVISDADKFFYMNSATSYTFTIPLNSAVAYPVGTELHMARYGTGEVTVGYTAGVTIVSEGSKKRINAQYQVVTAKKIATNTWLLFGALKT